MDEFETDEAYEKLLTPFLLPDKDPVENCDSSDNSITVTEMGDNSNPVLSEHPETADTQEPDATSDTKFQFYLTDEKGVERASEIVMEEQVKPLAAGRLNVLVCWSEKMLKQYNVKPLSLLPEVFKSGFFTKRPQESLSLFKCLEAFLKEVPLGPEDMWYFPVCKKHCQASKKLDHWRLQEILVIHLKRFSYSRFLKNKLETYVDFPIHDLDMSTYIAQKVDNLPTAICFMLSVTIMEAWEVVTTWHLFTVVVIGGMTLTTATCLLSTKTRSRPQLPMFYFTGEWKMSNLRDDCNSLTTSFIRIR